MMLVLFCIRGTNVQCPTEGSLDLFAFLDESETVFDRIHLLLLLCTESKPLNQLNVLTFSSTRPLHAPDQKSDLSPMQKLFLVLPGSTS